MLKKFALIVAGGSGSRMNNSIPKQFLELAGKPILMHTFEAFYRFDPGIEFILVLPLSEQVRWKKLCAKFDFSIPHRIANGGAIRFDSVKNGLDLITEDGIVFIHDGVRPLVSKETLNNCLTTTLQKGNALPVIPVSESIRYVDQEGNRSLDRSNYFLVQTPQTFRVNEIKAAYNKAISTHFTDDASVFESAGKKINTVAGNRENIKVTFQEDLLIAALFLKH